MLGNYGIHKKEPGFQQHQLTAIPTSSSFQGDRIIHSISTTNGTIQTKS